MPGLVPGIHAFLGLKQDVDGRVKPGHDAERAAQKETPYLASTSISPSTPGITVRSC